MAATTDLGAATTAATLAPAAVAARESSDRRISRGGGANAADACMSVMMRRLARHLDGAMDVAYHVEIELLMISYQDTLSRLEYSSVSGRGAPWSVSG